MPTVSEPPPLSLYVHLPWCVRKCPYCDFNSYETRAPIPERGYVDALLRDLEHDLPSVSGRPVRTVFFGGGTPSLFSPEAIAHLLHELRARVPFDADAEITLEANPGTVDAARFRGFRAAGVNRLSLGVQSFDDRKLAALGRIHDGDDARRAIAAAQDAGFDNLNLDLMFALPGQSVDDALTDVHAALAFAPTHVSAYQLTLEPDTPFYHRPPALPDDDTAYTMQEAVAQALAGAGFARYEVSAYARPGFACRHNLNYWRFGDYLGVGAGAHAKLTHARGITRLAKVRQPRAYLAHAGGADAIAETRVLSAGDALFEFMLNALRLVDGVPHALLYERTGLAPDAIEDALTRAERAGLLVRAGDRLRASARGRRFLNDLVAMFLPEATPARTAC